MSDTPEHTKQGGVWALPARPGRPKPYGCQWRETRWDPAANDGAGTDVRRSPSEFFPTAEQRDARMAQLRKDRRAGALRTVSRAEIEQHLAFRAAVGETPWQEVVAGWRADLTAKGMVPCRVTVDDAVRRELDRCAALVERQQMSADTQRQRKHKLRLFGEQFGHLRLTQLNAPDIKAWVEDFDHVEAGATFNNYVKHVRLTLQPYVDSGMLPRNPCAAIAKQDDSTDEVGINTPQEVAHLMAFALDTPRYRVAIGRLALEAFIGLRFSSGCRIEKADINFKDRGILLPKAKLKTGMVEGGRRHYIDGVLPEQIWEFLKEAPAEGWDPEQMTPRRYMQLKSDLFVEAGVLHPPNTFRHSFCTFDVAMHKSASRTAYILCHRDEDLLWTRYKGVQARGRIMTQADGRNYQALTPGTVQRHARGYVRPAELALPRG